MSQYIIDQPSPDAENCTIVSSFVWTKQRNATYGRTDRRTDSTQLTAVCTASIADAL